MDGGIKNQISHRHHHHPHHHHIRIETSRTYSGWIWSLRTTSGASTFKFRRMSRWEMERMCVTSDVDRVSMVVVVAVVVVVVAVVGVPAALVASSPGPSSIHMEEDFGTW